MDEEVWLPVAANKPMPPLVNLTAQRKWKAVGPVAAPTMVEFITVNPLTILGVFGARHRKLKVGDADL